MIQDKEKTKQETPEQKKERLANVISSKELQELTSTSGGGIALRDAVALTVNSDGICVLNWGCTVCGDDDFVGVYANASVAQGDNLGGNTGWQWCSHGSSYTTSVQAQAGYVAIYWSKDYRTGEYVRVCYTPILPNANPGIQVIGTTV